MGKNNDEDIPCVIPVGRAARADLIPRLLAVNFGRMRLSATSNKTLILIWRDLIIKGMEMIASYQLSLHFIIKEEEKVIWKYCM